MKRIRHDTLIANNWNPLWFQYYPKEIKDTIRCIMYCRMYCSDDMYLPIELMFEIFQLLKIYYYNANPCDPDYIRRVRENNILRLFRVKYSTSLKNGESKEEFETKESLDEYFKFYDHYEIYDPTKTYSTEKYVYEYCHGKPRTYENMLFRVQFPDEIGYYVVPIEHLSEQDKREMLPYCQCPIHSRKYRSWGHVFMYCLSIFSNIFVINPDSVGCIDSESIVQPIIYLTRKHMEHLRT